jgi:hypothetical protein
MGRRVFENKHSTEIRKRLTFRVNAHTDSQTGSLIAPSIQRRSNACSQYPPAHTDPRRLEEVDEGVERRVGRTLVLNDPPALPPNAMGSCRIFQTMS